MNINGGVLSVGDDDHLGSAANPVSLNGGTLLARETFSAASRVFTVGASGGKFSVDPDKTLSMSASGQVTGSGALVKSGAGTLTLNYSNTGFTGGLTIQEGTVSVAGVSGADSPLGAPASGVTLDGGTLLISGSLTANPSRTYVIGSNGGTFSVNASRTLTLGTTGKLSGSDAFIKTGAGAMTISASQASSYTGAVLVNQGALNLNAAAAFNGISGLSIDSGTVALGASQTIKDNAPISISNGGTLSLATWNETIGSLTMQRGIATSSSGTLTLGGNIVSLADHSSSTISSRLGLGGISRTFDVADGVAAQDLVISGAIGSGNGGIVKSGDGWLTLSGANAQTGLTTINAGTVSILNNENLGNVNNAVVINNGSMLNVAGTVSASGGRTFTIGNGGGGIDVNSGASLSMGAADAFRGSGAFNKTGDGSLTLGYANDASAIGFSGDFTLGGGMAELNAPGALGQVGSINISSGTLHFGASNAIRDGSTVNISGGGTMDLNGNDETIATLSMTGGSVATGAGTLVVSGDIISSAASTAANISGNIDLGSDQKSFQVADGSAANDMIISAKVTGAGGAIDKTGSGTLNLSGANDFSGGVVVNDGVLVASTPEALGTGALTIKNGAEVQAAFGSAATATLNGITIHSGAIRRTAANNLPSEFLQPGSDSLTVSGEASLIDQGGDGSEGYLGINGGININSGTLTLHAATIHDEVRLGGADNLTIAAGSILTTTGIGAKTFEAVSTRYLIGQGTPFNGTESTFHIGDNTSATHDLIVAVNGSGLGGLRIEGSNLNLTAFLDPLRLLLMQGTGGTLTLARNDSGDTLIDTAPFVPTTVKLGFDNVDGSSPTFLMGSSDNDLQNFGGLVVKGGTVSMGANQKFIGSDAPTSLDITGGVLELSAGIDQTTLEFTGTIRLTGGVIDGGGEGGTKGIIKTSGDVYSDGTTILYNPNLTMAPNIGTTILGGSTPLTGGASLGNFEKTGAGTVKIEVAVNATTISLNQGTLLLGAHNLLGDGAAVSLAGGTFASGGFNETVGTLTLANDSYIDLGSSSSVVQFADSHAISWSGGNLTIRNWSGINTGGGVDQLYFGSSDAGLSSGQVTQIRFEDPSGYAPGVYGAMILPTGEVVPIPVPVPEPKTVAALSFIALLIFYRERQLLHRLAGRFRRRNDSPPHG